MRDLRWKIHSIIFFTLNMTSIVDIVKGTPTKSSFLLNGLKRFSMNRHHVTNPRGKEQALFYIRDTLTSLGLHTWTEQFKAPGTPWNGTNIVGVLPGRQYKTLFDSLIVIGSHYDTMRNTNGADDNGSGVVAMLQVARLLVNTSSRCTREYSVMFVAFDFEEWENSSLPGWACDKLGCGSRAFMANFSQYWNSSPDMFFAPYGQLQGAIIMDTMMNYDSNPNSQIVPLHLNTIFPRQYNSITANQNRGDFLLITGRQRDDKELLDTFESCYNRIDISLAITGRERSDKYKLQVFPLPFDGPPSKLPERDKSSIRPFLRSDHVSFWNKLTSNRAIFLSDTANMRSYMRTCYHQLCDSLSHVTDDVLGFLSKSCDTIVMTTNALTKTRNSSSEGLTSGTIAKIVVAGICTFIGFVIVTVAKSTYCRRRSSDSDVLVDGDQLEEVSLDFTSPEPESCEDQSSV